MPGNFSYIDEIHKKVLVMGSKKFSIEKSGMFVVEMPDEGVLWYYYYSKMMMARIMIEGRSIASVSSPVCLTFREVFQEIGVVRLQCELIKH